MLLTTEIRHISLVLSKKNAKQIFNADLLSQLEVKKIKLIEKRYFGF